MTLPPELMDEILLHLRSDKQTLLNCSFVAKSWVYRSQKLLHVWHLSFAPETLRAWQETASLESMELLQHARLLTCSWFRPLESFRGDHLKSLYRLQHITLHYVTSARSDLTNCLPACQNTLSSLHLSAISVYDVAIMGLINYFPNLRELHIDRSTIWKDFWTTPSSSRLPRGKLRLTDLVDQHMSTLSLHLSKLELGYDEIEVVNTHRSPHPSVPPIIYACGKALTRLELSPPSSPSLLTLKNCSGLRELAFATSPMGPRSTELRLVESITSTNMRKITLIPYEDGWYPTYWSSLDAVLSNLVDRLHASGYEQTLEVEFRLEPKFAGLNPMIGLNTTLPRFRKKGRVTVTVLDPTPF